MSGCRFRVVLARFSKSFEKSEMQISEIEKPKIKHRLKVCLYSLKCTKINQKTKYYCPFLYLLTVFSVNFRETGHILLGKKTHETVSPEWGPDPQW